MSQPNRPPEEDSEHAKSSGDSLFHSCLPLRPRRNQNETTKANGHGESPAPRLGHTHGDGLGSGGAISSTRTPFMIRILFETMLLLIIRLGHENDPYLFARKVRSKLLGFYCVFLMVFSNFCRKTKRATAAEVKQNCGSTLGSSKDISGDN